VSIKQERRTSSGIYCESTAEQTIACCNVFNNDLENYAGYIADQTGLNGNISLDPGFCDLDSFTLWLDSPCSEANSSCGLIGARGVGCINEFPVITKIEDIGNDQGRQVRIKWCRSKYDTIYSSTQILSYEVYRRIDDLPGPINPNLGSIYDGLDKNRIVSDPLMYPPGDWYYLFSVPAHCEDVYNVVATTLEDSCAYNDSTYYSVFFIRAATSNPAIYFDSPVDSGYSVDNLPPFTPTNFTGEQFAYDLRLSWKRNQENDFSHYVIYRGDSIGFIPSADNILLSTCDTFAIDREWHPEHNNFYYKLVAFDLNGNMSKCALLVPEGVIATLVKNYHAAIEDGKVVIEWEMSEIDEGVEFSLLRSQNDEKYIELDSRKISGDNLKFKFVDDSYLPGNSYKYKALAGGSTLFETGEIAIPSMGLRLFQNYPNPFNPTTSIKYYLPADTHVSLCIYDVSGKLTRELVRDKQAKGYHVVTWDGKDSRGKSVGSGVYFYVLKADKKRITKKMVLLR